MLHSLMLIVGLDLVFGSLYRDDVTLDKSHMLSTVALCTMLQLVCRRGEEMEEGEREGGRGEKREEGERRRGEGEGDREDVM